MAHEKRGGVQPDAGSKQAARILKFLDRRGGWSDATPAGRGKISLGNGDRRHAFEHDRLEELRSAGLVTSSGSAYRITAAGRSHLRRLLHPENGFAAQHGERTARFRGQVGGAAGLCQNLAESPLGRLYLKRGKSGRPWLSPAEFEAGETLRRDFERANMQPRVTANWDSCGVGPREGRCAEGDIADFVLDARKRVEKALSELQHSLAEVALDVCCFLKGLEQVERERQWPPRSAKLMLRTALAGLAVHYGLVAQSARHGGVILHWGDGDYRPVTR